MAEAARIELATGYQPAAAFKAVSSSMPDYFQNLHLKSADSLLGGRVCEPDAVSVSNVNVVHVVQPFNGEGSNNAVSSNRVGGVHHDLADR